MILNSNNLFLACSSALWWGSAGTAPSVASQSPACGWTLGWGQEVLGGFTRTSGHKVLGGFTRMSGGKAPGDITSLLALAVSARSS